MKANWTNPEWTPKMEKILRAMWKQGDSATTIAVALQPHRPGMSRNAVVGKGHRLGLQRVQPKRLKGQNKQAPYQPHQLAANHQAIEQKLRGIHMKKKHNNLPKPKVEDVNRVGPVLSDMSSYQCRWPVGIETGADQMFCGCKIDVRVGTEGVHPYCDEHLERAQSKATPEMRERARQMGIRQARKNYNNGVGPFAIRKEVA